MNISLLKKIWIRTEILSAISTKISLWQLTGFWKIFLYRRVQIYFKTFLDSLFCSEWNISTVIGVRISMSSKHSVKLSQNIRIHGKKWTEPIFYSLLLRKSYCTSLYCFENSVTEKFSEWEKLMYYKPPSYFSFYKCYNYLIHLIADL